MAKVELPRVNANQLKQSTLRMKSINTSVLSISKILGKKSSFVEKKQRFQKDEKARVKAQKRKTDEVASLKVEKKEKKDNRITSAVKKKAGSMLDGIINAVTSIFAGWLAGKIPEIVQIIKDILPRVQAIFDGITKTVGRFFQWYQSFYAILWELGKSLITRQPPDTEKIRSEFNDMFSGWDEMFRSFGNGFNAIMGREFEDPEKIKRELKEGGTVDKMLRDGIKTVTGQDIKKPPKRGSGARGRGQQPQPSSGGPVSGNVTETEKAALMVLAKYESGAAGYNAVNQYGTQGGRGVEGFSGDIRKMPQHKGRAVTDMTIGEIKKLQYDDGSMSKQEWIEAGKLHAVGRYQFIGNTLPGVAARAGFTDDQKFNATVQDKMAIQLIKERGISPWVGPSDKATPAEKELVRKVQFGDGKPKTQATQGYLQAVKIGKMLNAQGVDVWQHPDFNVDTGYTGSGQERVMRRSYNSYHNYGEAIDIPLMQKDPATGQIVNAEKRLDKIAAMLGANKKKYGIAELKWKDDANHFDHIHVSFKGSGEGGTLPQLPAASVSPAPSSAPATAANVSSAGDFDSPSSNMQDQLYQALLSQQAQQPTPAAAPQGTKLVSKDGGGGDSTLPMGTLLNSMQRTRLLTALAYT